MAVRHSLISPWKRKGKKEKKKLLQHRVFVFGQPSKYYPRPTGLNFVETLLRLCSGTTAKHGRFSCLLPFCFALPFSFFICVLLFCLRFAFFNLHFLFFVCVFFFKFAFSFFCLRFLFFICVFFFFVCVFFFYLRFLFFICVFFFCLCLTLLGHRTTISSDVRNIFFTLRRRIRSDEGLALETSAFESLYHSGQFTLST